MTEHFSGGDLKSAAKLVILEEYADIYTTILGVHWDGPLWYVETHAGTGRIDVGEGVVIDGSSITILDQYADDFDRFYLYEIDQASFDTLVQTLGERFGYEFEVSEVDSPEADFLVARCDEPYIRIMNTDCNEGVTFLSEVAGNSSHWLTFVDPAGLTVRRSTLDTLIARSNMDIILNYQTTGVLRSAAAPHAHSAVDRQMGDKDWPEAGTPDEYVEAFKEKLEENPQIRPVITKNLESPRDRRHRFDLVGAVTNDTARNLMEERMNQDQLWEKADRKMGGSDYQSSLGSY